MSNDRPASFEWFLMPEGDTWHRWHNEDIEFIFACGAVIPYKVPVRILWHTMPGGKLCLECKKISTVADRRQTSLSGVCVIRDPITKH